MVELVHEVSAKSVIAVVLSKVGVTFVNVFPPAEYAVPLASLDVE